ncbi:hypothetical protein [Sphingomicrobium astaxanthinifaciens]|uniref:hypothetical protein n=1 Tax=Sphingomicrobium astaxanthinifaciens TaxID=1227949 RepID=UPI001FCA9D10|nr:hypothetical protein [Sphingomicrobium astaxanthinifaciens]MCJ7421186.1 hypothetical protein [Sphingomicrobium astaxanthinifaciens]
MTIEGRKSNKAGKRGGVLLMLGCAIGLAATSIPALAAVSLVDAAGAPPARSQTGRFTPAGADPRLAAVFANRKPSNSGFTPAGSNREEPRKLEVAARGSSSSAPGAAPTRRVAEVVDSPRRSATLTPSNYDLGVDVGWKRFRLSTEVAEQNNQGGPALLSRDRARVGLSYGTKVSGQVAVSADRETSRAVPSIRATDSYALDVGGAVKITNNIAITGGVRYRIDQERLPEADLDGRRYDSQAVYVGTKLKF